MAAALKGLQLWYQDDPSAYCTFVLLWKQGKKWAFINVVRGDGDWMVGTMDGDPRPELTRMQSWNCIWKASS